MVLEKHLAYAIAKAIKQQGYSVAFMHIPMLMERIKATYNETLLKQQMNSYSISNIDLLVLDDVGVENTEHIKQTVFNCR